MIKIKVVKGSCRNGLINLGYRGRNKDKGQVRGEGQNCKIIKNIMRKNERTRNKK